jgi:hypothetical protein
VRAFPAGLLLLIASAVSTAAPTARVRHEGRFADGSVFERFAVKQRSAETFDLELSAGATTCVYRVGWFQARPNGLVRTVDLQAKRQGECALSPATDVDAALVLDRAGAGGVVRLIHEKRATELAVDRAWEPAP